MFQWLHRLRTGSRRAAENANRLAKRGQGEPPAEIDPLGELVRIVGPRRSWASAFGPGERARAGAGDFPTMGKSDLDPLSLARGGRGLAAHQPTPPRTLRARPPARRADAGLAFARLQSSKTQDHNAIVLSRPAHGRQAIDDGRLDVDEALAALSLHGPRGRALGQRRADGFIGGGRDGDADHCGTGSRGA